MSEDITPSGLRRVEYDATRTHEDVGGQYTESGVSEGRRRGGGSNTLRTSDADDLARREGSRWGDIVSGLLTALTTFLLRRARCLARKPHPRSGLITRFSMVVGTGA